jgi:hypothetical protein
MGDGYNKIFSGVDNGDSPTSTLPLLVCYPPSHRLLVR